MVMLESVRVAQNQRFSGTVAYQVASSYHRMRHATPTAFPSRQSDPIGRPISRRTSEIRTLRTEKARRLLRRSWPFKCSMAEMSFACESHAGMITILVDLLSMLCLLTWLVCFAAAVGLALLVAIALGQAITRASVQRSRYLSGHAAWLQRMRHR